MVIIYLISVEWDEIFYGMDGSFCLKSKEALGWRLSEEVQKRLYLIA